jgi:LysM repeat protein
MGRVRLLLIVVTMMAILLVAVPAYASPANTAGGSGCGQFYTVQCGDTLNKIAVRFGTSVWALQQLNGISNPNLIYAGQTICVKGSHHPPPPPPPPPGPHPKPPPAHGGFWYTVHPGEMLRIIAARYGWGTWYLANVNHIPNPDKIYAGQRLWIPAH